MRALLLAVMISLAHSSAPQPAELLERMAARAIADTGNPEMWSWSYGPAIMVSQLYNAAGSFKNSSWAAFADGVLDDFIADSNAVAYKVLHNETMPWDAAVGDHIGLYPIAYVARDDYRRQPNSTDTTISSRVAEEYVMGWPYRLDDAASCFSRYVGWPGQKGDKASFVWADDQFMGLTLLSRLARHQTANATQYVDSAAKMQLQYADYLQDRGQAGGPGDNLMYHGYNAASNETSCCKWGRANGWIMMGHIEVLEAVDAVAPHHPLRDALITLLTTHASAMVKVQHSSGAWHQVLNETATFLETSVTAMTMFSIARGIARGWLDKEAYETSVHRAYAALAGQIQADGTVTQICSGCGIQPNAETYNRHSTNYEASQPGLGSVWRAVTEYAAFEQDS